ncbi:hydrogenase expression protein HypF [Streptomyces sp. SCUT-3]|nr:hydrogenase expression protein HypF [Streptomyces sp. SCUT-3]
MRGDEAQAAPDGRARATGPGPRHAAPRKSLLTRLQVPTGRAIALAAMPTAVLMGMGLTPKLAQADELPENPFAPGPCVTQPDRPPEEEETQSATPAPAAPSAGASAPAAQEPSGGGTAPRPGASTGGGGAGEAPAPTASPTAPAQEDAQQQEAAAEEDGRTGLLDPIIDPIKDFFEGGPKGDEPQEPAGEEAAASPSPSATAPQEGTGDPAGDAAEKAGDAAKDAADTAGDAARQAAEDAASAEPVEPAESAGPAESADATEPEQADGKQPYPCPTYDAEALADAEYEKTPTLLPDRPWTLETSLLALHGLDYKGIVKVRTANGTVKDVLKFTASGVDIRDLHQLVDGGGGVTYHVQARKGSTSEIRNGTVTMYTESLKGNLFGLIPVTFSPESPPPLNVPEAFFTKVTVVQAGQFGGTLKIPGMRLYND